MARAAPESRQQARTIAYSLARALRALAGGLSWERLGRNALLENASEILSKSLPEASRDLPELTLALLGLILTLLGVIWGLLGLMLGLLGLILGLLGRSWALLGRSWGASGEPLGPSKTLQNRSRRLSRRPPAPELDFGSILGVILAPFWDPPDLKKRGFRVEGVSFFEKTRGSEKHPKNGNLAIMEREAREVRERTSIASKARAARAAKTARGRAAGSPRGAKARVARAAPESRQQAHTIPYSLARALRALAGGLSWERLGRIALL